MIMVIKASNHGFDQRPERRDVKKKFDVSGFDNA